MDICSDQSTHAEHERSPKSIPAHIAPIVQQFAEDARRLLHGNVVNEYLFGSYAKETSTPLSDIDMLFLVQRFTPDLRGALSELASKYSLKYDVCISPVIKDMRVWLQNKRYNTLFYQEVTRYGIPL